MAVFNLSPFPVLRFCDNSGNALTGGKLFTYTAGTTTKQNTFTDSTGGTPNANPVILNSRGEANVWLDMSKAYKFVLSPSTDTDPPTSPIWTVDNINALLGGASGFGTQTSLASNTTTDLGSISPDTNNILVTGTTTITSFGSSALTTAPVYLVKFNAVLTLTNNNTSLILPGFANIVTLAGDMALCLYLGSGNWQVLCYQRANGQPISGFGAEQTLASASTTDLGSTNINLIQITGTTTITSFGSSANLANAIYLIRFNNILTLTYNATSLILPTKANITTANGDAAIAQYLGSGNWVVREYIPVSGKPLALPTGTLVAVDAYTTHGTYTWTQRAAVVSAIGEAAGAGGGGAGAAVTAAAHVPGAGGGGNSGAYTKGQIASVAASYTITVGQGGGGGTGANPGSAGGNSSIGTVMIVTGGAGGKTGNNPSSADVANVTALSAAATVSTAGNIISAAGTIGAYGLFQNRGFAQGGYGAPGPWGGGGLGGQLLNDTDGAANGTAATTPAAGGGGAGVYSNANSQTANGAAGADGAVFMYSYS